MILEEIALGENPREAIQEFYGREAIVQDDSYGWLHGTISECKGNQDMYEMKLFCPEETRHLFYNDTNHFLLRRADLEQECKR